MDLNWMLSKTIIILYACAVMYILLDVNWKQLPKKRRTTALIYFFVFLTLNISAQMILGRELYGKFYMLLTQIPVFFLFWMISKYKGIKLFFVLLTTVFFSAPIILLLSIFGTFMEQTVLLYLLFCIIMFLCIDRFFKIGFHYMLELSDNKMILTFTAIPLLYYIYSYALTGYQFHGMVVDKTFLIRNISFVIVFLSYILLMQIIKMVYEKAEMENAQLLAVTQLNTANEQLEQLRMAEKQSAIHRHDLRHHMNYINSCIAENKLQEAMQYIQQTCDDIDNMVLHRYSDNEPINLILSSYVGKAKAKGIAADIQITAADFSRFHITDLCSLLSNALENAIHGCEQLEGKDRLIRLRIYEKNNNLCIDIRNRYKEEPVFENNIPVSKQEGHGLGIKSMIQVIEKYDGIYGFTAKDGEFRFQLSM